ncbi:MAG: MCP four helix bundle domain-containing protein [Nitrospirae bacterium]|nr:MCP four helix bundle domain-containing protein [Nitrospirota bacterium]
MISKLSVIKNIKISSKVLFIAIMGLVIILAYAAGIAYMGMDGTKTLEMIYQHKVMPLDDLRQIQFVFREIEYRMVGVKAEIADAIPSGKHLNESIGKIDALWGDINKAITVDDLMRKEIEGFEKGYDGFKAVASRLEKVYLGN